MPHQTINMTKTACFWKAICSFLPAPLIGTNTVEQEAILERGSPEWFIAWDCLDYAFYNHPQVPLVISCCDTVAEQMQSTDLTKPIITIRHELQPSYSFDDVNKYRQQIRSHYGIEDQTFFVGMVGSLKPQKCYRRALAILDQLLAHVPAKLFIAGGWDNPDCQKEYDAVKTEIQKLRLQEHVIFGGNVMPVEPFYAAFDVLLNTSSYEGLSISTLEAQHYGCPIVAANVGGQAETLDRDSLVTPIEDIAGYTQKLLAVARNRSQQRIGLPTRSRLVSSLWWLLGNYGTADLWTDNTQIGTLFVINNLNLAGAQRSLTNLLSHPLFDRNCGICVLDETRNSAHLERLHAAGIPVWQLHLNAGLTERVEQFLQLLKTSRFNQVCFWNAAPKFKLLSSKILAAAPIRIVDVSPGSMYFEELETNREFQDRISWSEEQYLNRLQALVVKYAAGKPNRACRVPITVIPNGVDSTAINAATGDSPLCAEIDPHLAIGTCSRITPVKRIEWLIDMMQILGDQLPGASLTIVGGVHSREKSYEEFLHKKLRQCRYQNVYFVGEQSDVRPYLQHFKLFVMVSEPGGCPNASLEAMSAGLPVIATRFGGAIDQIQSGVNGYLVDRVDPTEMAVHVTTLLSQPTLLNQMSQSARQTVEKSFSIKQMVGKYLELLNQC